MHREERSERSRRQVLDAALQLFSRQGYRATTMREIADAAGVSTGNVYHHFPDKESIFKTLLDEYNTIVDTARFPFSRALRSGIFPDNLELLGFAARDSVRQFRQYMALIFVDVIEFDGTHIRNFYAELGRRFLAVMEDEGALDAVKARIRPGVSPLSAVLLATRVFFSYFQLEILFGVPEPFGKESAEVVREIAEILRSGMVSK
jgi:AcrR family transcriptional regulator